MISKADSDSDRDREETAPIPVAVPVPVEKSPEVKTNAQRIERANTWLTR
jgi:hypothetical protein